MNDDEEREKYEARLADQVKRQVDALLDDPDDLLDVFFRYVKYGYENDAFGDIEGLKEIIHNAATCSFSSRHMPFNRFVRDAIYWDAETVSAQDLKERGME